VLRQQNVDSGLFVAGLVPVVHAEEPDEMSGIGTRLRKIRTEWGLSLREIEERSLKIVRASGNPAYQISASWLARLEREEHELTAAKLIALAAIYSLPYEEVLGYPQPEFRSSCAADGHGGPNTTLLLHRGPLDEEARLALPDRFTTDPPPEETALLPPIPGTSPGPYRRAIVGRHDRALDPMIRAGSILQVHTQRRVIAPREDWIHEFDRPIYLLLTRIGYVCGWCELDKEATWLTLLPHPLSHANSQRWRYKKEVEVVGQVVAVHLRLI
jgi:transcriptional regulator with XRE-family HTH domain